MPRRKASVLLAAMTGAHRWQDSVRALPPVRPAGSLPQRLCPRPGSTRLPDLEPREPSDGCAMRREDLLDRLLLVLLAHRGLLKKPDVLEERIDPALNDLGDR